MDQERRGEEIAQKAEPGEDRGERMRLRGDVEELDLQHVARLGALDEDGPREGMDGAGFHVRHVRLARPGAELAVDAVARGQHHLFVLVDREERGDVRVEPVVTRRRLIFQSLAAVDLDALHGSPPVHSRRTFAIDPQNGVIMTDQSYHVYVIQGRGQRPLNVVNPEVYAPGAVRRAR